MTENESESIREEQDLLDYETEGEQFAGRFFSLLEAFPAIYLSLIATGNTEANTAMIAALLFSQLGASIFKVITEAQRVGNKAEHNKDSSLSDEEKNEYGERIIKNSLKRVCLAFVAPATVNLAIDSGTIDVISQIIVDNSQKIAETTLKAGAIATGAAVSLTVITSSISRLVNKTAHAWNGFQNYRQEQGLINRVKVNLSKKATKTGERISNTTSDFKLQNPIEIKLRIRSPIIRNKN